MSQQENNELLSVTGRVEYIVYRSEETLYTVLRVRTLEQSEKLISVTGMMASVETDVIYRFYGTYQEHPKYGMQFVIESYDRPLPSEEEGIVRYLSGVQFPGIGKKTAEKIVQTLGENCLQQIREDSNVLLSVPGLKQEKIEIIVQGLAQETDGMEDLIRFLNIHGIGMRNLIRLNRTYGKEALSKIQENPYRVIEECDGFGFVTADKIAMSLGFEKDDNRRLYALLISLCMKLCMKDGDSFVSRLILQEAFEKECVDLNYDFDDLLMQTLLKRQLVQEEDRIYPVSQYDAEEGIASFLSQFPYEEMEHMNQTVLLNYLEHIQEEFHISYDEDQIKAIQMFFDEPISIITGGPGTGKTTVVRAMVRLFQLLYPAYKVQCIAPTGRAAKRLSELTNNDATTIHSLLKWDLETNTFGMNEESPILADLLIIDEFSMVDNWLFYNLIRASHQVKKICIIGDEDQLQSVSPGALLRDFMEAKVIPSIRLQHIYRQQSGSDVISLAHDIRKGTVDFSNYSNDLTFFECRIQDIKDNVLKVVQTALERGYEMNDIQVLSPMYDGAAGIHVLNNALQACFNPASNYKRELKVGYLTFRIGDKILQLKNQPDDDVFNGDIGILEEIYYANEMDNHKTTLVVNFDSIYVEYTLENIQNITLAYAISVHKSQGSEYPIVIFPMTKQHNILLQRKLIYTGVTRARKSLILLGEKKAFELGIQTLDRHPRQTTLTSRIVNRLLR